VRGFRGGSGAKPSGPACMVILSKVFPMAIVSVFAGEGSAVLMLTFIGEKFSLTESGFVF